MKFISIIINVLFILNICLDNKIIVSADRMIRFIFNNGNTPDGSTYCNDSDNAKINAIFGSGALSNRRERDLGHSSSNETVSTSSDRQLFAGYCKNHCAGFTAKTCRATGCVGYRRNRELGNASDVYDNRNLQATCAANLDAITNPLNALISSNQVSATCKSYLSTSTRSTSCFDDVIYGEVEGAKLWDLSTSIPTVMTENMPNTGYSFCTSKKFAITAINHPCVDDLKFELYGPETFYVVNYQYKNPYSLFGTDTSGNLVGTKLAAEGEYILKLTPDNLYHKIKEYRFTLDNGNIDGVKVWDLSSSTPTVMINNLATSGQSFCAPKIAFTATNNPCIDRMKFELYGPNWYSVMNKKYDQPYAIFDKEANGSLKGVTLSEGSYELKLTPSDNFSKHKVYRFQIDNGQVEGVKVWDLSSSTPTVMKDSMPATGYSFCASKRFALTSINNPCIDRMKFEIYGPNGYKLENVQYGQPYAIFGKEVNGNLKGEILCAGSYELKVTPGEVYEKQKVFRFQLLQC